MALNINQLRQSPVQGMMDLRFNMNVISCEVDISSAGGLVPGQAVKIVNSAGGVPKVVEAAAASDAIFGFLVFDIKSQAFNALDKVEVAVFRGNVQYMTAGAAIARGAALEIVPASKKVVTAATSGAMVVGQALDKAAADGDLIRVVVDLPGAFLP